MEDKASASGWQRQFAESQLWPVLSFAGYNVLLLGVLLFSDFNAYDLLVVIYLELWVIGVFALLRLMTAVLFGRPFDSNYAEASRGTTLLLGTFLAGFFMFKFGALMLILGMVIVMLPGEQIGLSWAEATELHPLVELCVWVLLIRYGVVFVWSTLIKGDYKEVSSISLLLSPYLQGLWAGVTIGVGVFYALMYPDNPVLWFTLGIFATKLVLDLFSLLLALRHERLAPEKEARKAKREARARTVSMWLARGMVGTMGVVIIGALAFAGMSVWRQADLENDLVAEGVVIVGTVQGKEMSPGSGNSSTSYAVQVAYEYQQQSFAHRYWIRQHRWEALNDGDAIEVTVLPEQPCLSQLTEYVGSSLNGRGWVALDRRCS